MVLITGTSLQLQLHWCFSNDCYTRPYLMLKNLPNMIEVIYKPLQPLVPTFLHSGSTFSNIKSMNVHFGIHTLFSIYIVQLGFSSQALFKCPFYTTLETTKILLQHFAEILQQKTESESHMLLNLNSKSPLKVCACVNLFIFFGCKISAKCCMYCLHAIYGACSVTHNDPIATVDCRLLVIIHSARQITQINQIHNDIKSDWFMMAKYTL